jgi:hypothetical protein
MVLFYPCCKQQSVLYRFRQLKCEFRESILQFKKYIQVGERFNVVENLLLFTCVTTC